MYCQCGCGQLAPIAKKTRAHLGHHKGEPVRFLPGHSKRGHFGAYKTARWREEDRGLETPCWVWQLAQTGAGYGCEWDRERGRMVGAHILAYERENGPVPEGLELDHLCRVRLCVNPAHLQAITHAENVRRGDYRTNSSNARKTHCPKGHPYSGVNLYIEPGSGTRRCRTCRREARRSHI